MKTDRPGRCSAQRGMLIGQNREGSERVVQGQLIGKILRIAAGNSPAAIRNSFI